MKTLLTIKNELAHEGYSCTFMQAVTFLDKIALGIFMDEVAKRYAEEALKEASEKVCLDRYVSSDYIRGGGLSDEDDTIAMNVLIEHLHGDYSEETFMEEEGSKEMIFLMKKYASIVNEDVNKEITRLQEKYDENGYDCTSIIKLKRIEGHIDSVINMYRKDIVNEKKDSAGSDAIEFAQWIRENWIVGTNDLWRRQVNIRDQRTDSELYKEYLENKSKASE